MHRLPQVVLLASVGIGSWLGMQAVHELGHALGAWCSGGSIAQAVLHPLTISRTEYRANPQPLVAVWAGPLVGILLPLILWGVAAALRLSESFLLRFFAGFCLIANGAYIGGGATSGVGDCGEMLRHGSPLWVLWLFGLVTVPAGIFLWHGQGKFFGLGSAQGVVERRAVWVSLAACLALLALGLTVSGL